MKIVNEFILGYFIWWYRENSWNIILTQRKLLGFWTEFSGLSIHSKYLFTPIYNAKSITARIFSFFIRFSIVLFGIFSSALILLISLAALIMYYLLPTLPVAYLWLTILI